MQHKLLLAWNTRGHWTGARGNVDSAHHVASLERTLRGMTTTLIIVSSITIWGGGVEVEPEVKALHANAVANAKRAASQMARVVAPLPPAR